VISEGRYLSRAETAEFLTERGYKTAPATLAKLAVIGGGPPFISWGRKPLYDPAALLEWAQRRCTGPRRSTSDRGEANLPTEPSASGDDTHPPLGRKGAPLESEDEQTRSKTARFSSAQDQQPDHRAPPPSHAELCGTGYGVPAASVALDSEAV
jgi:hypothetical protein